MHCEILTLFPGFVREAVSYSMLKRAQEKGLLHVRIHDIRDYTDDPHRTADDAPYGGGAGMIMKAEPLFRAVDAVRAQCGAFRLILPSPQGEPFTQRLAQDLSREERPLVFICGHYEGFDERIRLGLGGQEVSIGDYVVTGGELPTLVMIDAAVRLIPGVLGDPTSAQYDSFTDGLLDYPHYTRPVRVRGLEVPPVLLSGNHKAIHRWRRKEALRNTYCKRPDLLKDRVLSQEDRRLLEEVLQEEACEWPLGEPQGSVT
ncbi:MAG: tRNA (guanosine(37)-N1)-methyltransferase TrmD [Nitrospirae bacterium]|nr:MAG: tRNA (guanosine(37)-N1)-methyltransferase TrmD [Nitrospirota bacterium]